MPDADRISNLERRVDEGLRDLRREVRELREVVDARLDEVDASNGRQEKAARRAAAFDWKAAIGTFLACATGVGIPIAAILASAH